MKVPPTKKVPTAENLHGTQVHDDYRWLENLKDKDVLEWVDEQNAYTKQQFAEHTQLDDWKKRVERFTRVTRHTLPIRKNGIHFYIHQEPQDDLPTIMVRLADGREKPLLDLPRIAQKKSINLEFWSPSPDGTLLAYGISEGGNEIPILRIRSVESGEDLDDEIINARGEVTWLDDGSGFFYTRSPRPGTVPENDVRMHTKVYLHILGNTLEEDEMIFGEGRPKDDMLALSRTYGAPYLCIWVAQSWDHNDIYLYNVETHELRPLITGRDNKFTAVALKDRLLIRTDLDAPRQKILSTGYDDLERPLEEYDVVIPESERFIEYYYVTRSRLFVGYSHDASEEVEIYDYEGRHIKRLEAPEISLVNLTTSPLDDEVYYSIDTMVGYGEIYKMDAQKLEPELVYQPNMPHNPDDFIVTREWATSPDGTRLPIFVVTKKGTERDGHTPTLIWAYGGFGISQEPYYIGALMAWVEAGGVYALAIIRGGGEYGEDWHRKGIREYKQNSFDDFAASIECLIDKKYTDSAHVAIYGGSNGGLLVGAVATQHPKLMKAVICQVPLLDMYHYHTLLIAGRWKHEYGDPEKARDFGWLQTWSPYHQIKAQEKYPAFFLITGENDTRVHPMHAMKMTAALQNVDEPSVTLLDVQRSAGHTNARPRTQAIEAASQRYAFAAWQLGLELT